MAVPLANAYYGPGSGPIYVDDLDCIGNETNIGQCDRKPLTVNDCEHNEDAGLMCLGKIFLVLSTLFLEAVRTYG